MAPSLLPRPTRGPRDVAMRLASSLSSTIPSTALPSLRSPRSTRSLAIRVYAPRYSMASCVLRKVGSSTSTPSQSRRRTEERQQLIADEFLNGPSKALEISTDTDLVTLALQRRAASFSWAPEIYHRCLGPALFEPYAADLARRLVRRAGDAVLETACGTGILTRQLRSTLAPAGRLVATDIDHPIIDHAR